MTQLVAEPVIFQANAAIKIHVYIKGVLHVQTLI